MTRRRSGTSLRAEYLGDYNGRLSMDVFLARQPIFDRNLRVYAYELLFRSGLENYFNHPDRDQASSKVIADSFLLFDLQSLTGGKKAFVNVTKDVLLKEYAMLLPKELVVVEILETVEADPGVMASCANLKAHGFPLALDDFVYKENNKALIDLADIIKVDVLESGIEGSREIKNRIARPGLKFLAEKVETQEVFEQAMAMGYDLFQGYFFSKPVIVSKKDVPPYKLHFLRMLQEIHRPEVDYRRLEEIIKQDVSMSYKLIRYINSPFFGIPSEIHSIQQALMLLGEREIKKWVTLIAVASMSEDKPMELVMHAVVRAGFCEALAGISHASDKKSDMFLMGLFSLIDAMMDRPLAELLKEMPINPEVKSALVGETNTYRDIFEIAIRYEKGDWVGFSERCSRQRVAEDEVPAAYMRAIAWAREGLGATTA